VIPRERARSVVGRVIIIGCLSCLAIAAQPEIATAQVPQNRPDFPAAQESVDPAPPIVVDPQKKNAVWLAFMMWAGIIFGGVILLALVVMWGNRTRRLARSPLPLVAKRDELWFLKPKPPTDEADSAGPSDSGSNAG
jgi:heme/copper-type cytochrome/quinol oxidase subunit 2